MPDTIYGSDKTFAYVDDGIIRATDSGEWGAKVVWHSKYSQPLIHQIYYFITKKQNPIKTEQIISHDHIKGFKNSNYGLLGYGGFSHLGINNGGYVVKFYKVNDSWRSEHIIHTKEIITDLKECNDGLRLLFWGYSTWIHYSFVDNKFIKDDLFSSYKSENIQNIIENHTPQNKFICYSCGSKAIKREYIVQCGPCGHFFCQDCWEKHQWSHGKSPAIGISFQADDTFSGFDGSERIK